MTREEHIENLKAIASDMPSDKCSDWIESLMAGVKALEQQSTDAVDRQAVLEVIRKCHCEEWVKADIGAPIEALPSVTPQQKIGKWNKSMDDYSYFYTCSCCGQRIAKNGFGDDLFSPYCPECGAKMQEVEG